MKDVSSASEIAQPPGGLAENPITGIGVAPPPQFAPSSSRKFGYYAGWNGGHESRRNPRLSTVAAGFQPTTSRLADGRSLGFSGLH
jgi:hypothetical protein